MAKLRLAGPERGRREGTLMHYLATDTHVWALLGKTLLPTNCDLPDHLGDGSTGTADRGRLTRRWTSRSARTSSIWSCRRRTSPATGSGPRLRGLDEYLSAPGEREGLTRPGLIHCFLQVLHVFSTCPQIQVLCPPPGQARRGSLAAAGADGRAADPRRLERVRALLAKAESTSFAAEAETYTAKAQELMARHSIDYALLSVGAVCVTSRSGGASVWRTRMGCSQGTAKRGSRMILMSDYACSGALLGLQSSA